MLYALSIIGRSDLSPFSIHDKESRTVMSENPSLNLATGILAIYRHERESASFKSFASVSVFFSTLPSPVVLAIFSNSPNTSEIVSTKFLVFCFKFNCSASSPMSPILLNSFVISFSSIPNAVTNAFITILSAIPNSKFT